LFAFLVLFDQKCFTKKKKCFTKTQPAISLGSPIFIRRFWQEIVQINALDLKHKPKPKI